MIREPIEIIIQTQLGIVDALWNEVLGFYNVTITKGEDSSFYDYMPEEVISQAEAELHRVLQKGEN